MNRHHLLALMLAALAIVMPLPVAPLLAAANTETVTMEELHVPDVILLPTVSSSRDVGFTKPKTWQLSGAHLHLEFQHSIELLPDRSWLEIIVNNVTVKHIPLTQENAKRTVMEIPIPTGNLKDVNTLRFLVEQHYTDKCEDPLDKSLWTQIHPESKLVFDYTPTLPLVDLKTFPYPIIDPLGYGDTHIRYVMPVHPTAKELRAMALVNVYLAQASGVRPMVTDVTSPGYQSAEYEHLVYIGTSSDNADIARFTGGHSAGHGLLVLTTHPQYKNRGILVVTGSDDDAVEHAAEFVTTRPLPSGLSGTIASVPDGWNQPNAQSAKLPRFIERQDRTFNQLGFTTQEVHKIYAPPIVYNIPVVTDFSKHDAKLWVDIDYSYGPQLNPLFSSLEVRWNNISIANIPLLNPQGETNQHASVPVSTELIQPNNTLVAQFHLMPDKYGWCVNTFVDNAWARIMDTSKVRIDGAVESLLPDVGLMNSTGYPYTRTDNLSSLHIQLPDANLVTPAMMRTVLGVTTRLGRVTNADTDLQFSLSADKSAAPGGKNVLAIQNPASAPLGLNAPFRLDWLPGAEEIKRFVLADKPKIVKIADRGNGVYLEQIGNGGDNITTLISSTSQQGFGSVANLFENDHLFQTLDRGPVKQMSLQDDRLSNVKEEPFHEEKVEKKPNWWDFIYHINWVWVFGGLLLFFALLVLLPVIRYRLRR